MSGDPTLFAETSSTLHAGLLQHQQQQQHQQQAAAAPPPAQQPQQLPPQPSYPPTLPSTPLNHASPASATSPNVKISPETLASLTSAVQSGSPFSGANSVISPTGSTFSAGHLSDLSAGGGGSGDGSTYGMAAMALANAMNAGGQTAGVVQQGVAHAQGVQGVTAGALQQLGMEVDLSFPTPPTSGPSSNGTGASTPATAPNSAYFYPPGTSPLPSQIVQSSLPPPSHPAPTLAPPQRHHPYAHPSRPTINTAVHSQPASAASIPLFLSTPSPATATGRGNTPPPPSAGSEASSMNLGLGLPPVHPHAPTRVHSAPAHILTLATKGLDNYGSPLASANSEAPPPSAVFSDMGQSVMGEGDPMLLPPHPIGMGSGAGSAPATTPAAGLGSAFHSGMTPLDTQQQQQAVPPPPPSVASAPAGEDERMLGYNEMVSSAISLLGKRLPIMEAALSSSEVESGNDEEEIWKGIEGAYEELKRIMGDRKDARRVALGLPVASKGAGSKRAFSTMELESPITPVDGDRPHAASAFLAAHPPPLHHSYSSPDVPIASQASAARQANLAQIQLQQQTQLQQAQLQAQAQAEAHARAQAQLQAEAERARAEAEQRARAEEEVRAQMEAEARARAEAEAEAAAQHQLAEQARREADQYSQMMHEDQLRAAREVLHRQMQESAAGAPQVLPNPPPPPSQPTPTPQPSQQTPQPAPQQPPPPTPQQPPPQQQQLPNGQLVFATPQQAQAYAMQMQLQGAPVVAPNGAVTLVPVLGLPPNNLPPAGMSQPPSLPQSAVPVQQPPMTSQFPVGFDPSGTGGDLSMMQQLQYNALGYAPATSLPPQPDSVDPSAISSAFNPAGTAPAAIVSPATVSPPNASTAAFAGSASVGSGAGPVRPSRSRAASQSGYTSSGSRSRAASGSGYQVLLESRSRAASSASSVFQTYERDDEDDDDDGMGGDVEQDIDVGGDGPAKGRGQSSQMGAASAGVDADLTARINPVFMDFLADICSNLEATDSKGEPIHQTLMAKKMEKLDQSHDFRPFKFRIQAFTTAFAERLAASGVFEHEVPVKKVRQYLWAQPYISRFNDDGKKAKSKGNHIWTVEAKKIPEKKWIFREFTRCIKGSAPPVAFIGVTWSWAPRVWDPQCSSAAIDASFMSPTLPPWLTWEDNVLHGEPPESAHNQTFEIEAVATFQLGNKVHQLKATTSFDVHSPNETDDPAAYAASAAAALSRSTRDYLQEPEERKPNTSGASSQIPSPEESHSALYRSPSLGSSGIFEAPPNTQLLPAPLNGSGGSSSYANSGIVTPASGLEVAFAPLEQQQQQVHQQQQQQLPDPSTWPQPDQQQQPAAAMMQVEDQQAALEQQAALHHHYATLSMQQGQPFDTVPPGAMSFAPPPDLVSNALQNASGVNPTFTSVNPGMISHAPSGAGTPGGVFALHDMGQQPPFTLDPSTL
ncbi:hypothetical protein JCM6882_007648 [Rhodosporidiobolus microsporus]